MCSLNQFFLSSIICFLQPPVIVIRKKNQHFILIQLMIYIIFIIENIHDIMNEFKMFFFLYNSDCRVHNTNAIFIIRFH